ncbi:MAG: hypothetical protein QE263_07485 [Vampirovibrionales bacterium]|nr:hypothetical protein [Vampirovibrionales bacterium]
MQVRAATALGFYPNCTFRSVKKNRENGYNAEAYLNNVFEAAKDSGSDHGWTLNDHAWVGRDPEYDNTGIDFLVDGQSTDGSNRGVLAFDLKTSKRGVREHERRYDTDVINANDENGDLKNPLDLLDEVGERGGWLSRFF